MNKINEKESEKVYRSGMIHSVISNSYITFLSAIILGIILDSFVNFKLFGNHIFQYLGFIMVIIGPALVYWSQWSSRVSKEKALKNGVTLGFEYGPYKFTRNPSYLGVFVMVMGLGFIFNSISSLFFGIIAYFVVKFVFIKQEEHLLFLKFGQSYLDYKNKVRNRL